MKRFINRWLRRLWVRGNAQFDRDVRSIVADAWEDNIHGAIRRSGWVKLHFNERIGDYVRWYFEQTGMFPEGIHNRTYFRPRIASSNAPYIEGRGRAPKSA